MISDSRNSVEVYLWSDEDRSFSHEPSYDLKVDGEIEGLTPGDFNLDGRLDLLITRSLSPDHLSEVYIQTEYQAFSPIPFSSFNVSNQPAAFDVNGDMNVDLLFNAPNDQGDFTAFVAEKHKTDSAYTIKKLSEYAFLSSEVCYPPGDRKLATPHSVGFVDLNKDCWADMFLTTVDGEGKTFFEIWLNMKNGSYCIVQVSEALEGTGHVTFADVDRNGVEDLIFPHKNSIHVIFNDNKVSTDCKFDIDEISYKKFDKLDITATNTTNKAAIIPLEPGVTFAEATENMPNMLRTGDLDLDGYPDLIVVLKDAEGEFCALMDNENTGDGGRRRFKVDIRSEFDKLKEKRGAVLCSFFDLDENGILDILITHRNATIGQSTTVAFYNNFLDDAFHLKAMTLSGFGKQKYSSAYSGPIFMFTITELDMTPVQMHSTQMPQTAYFALQTPYCIYGIGRTNSYIENLYVNIPTVSHPSKMWTPVIPNSYLIMSPNRVKMQKKVDLDGWFLELFASPTDKIGVIIIGAVVFLILTGGIVVYRYRREKDEDREYVGGFL